MAERFLGPITVFLQIMMMLGSRAKRLVPVSHAANCDRRLYDGVAISKKHRALIWVAIMAATPDAACLAARQSRSGSAITRPG